MRLEPTENGFAIDAKDFGVYAPRPARDTEN